MYTRDVIPALGLSESSTTGSRGVQAGKANNAPKSYTTACNDAHVQSRRSRDPLSGQEKQKGRPVIGGGGSRGYHGYTQVDTGCG